MEVKLLRAGDYHVEALWMTKHENGRWFPTGRRLHARARVDAGRTSACTLR